MQSCPMCGHSPVDAVPACPSCGAPLVQPHLPAGQRLAKGRYAVGKVLGQGGFGITYLGSDMILSRRVAIKELFPEGSTRKDRSVVPPLSSGPQVFADVRSRFLDEARTMAQFNHPGIVHVLDVFQENGTAYLVMEFLEGQTLAGRIEKAGRLAPDEVMTLAMGIGQALEVVHAAGLLHRDIKPDNLFLTKDGRIVLIDFGSARGYARGKTVRHTRLVTPGYAPLEQYASEARFGPYTDVYALGATLYHALTGAPPPAPTDRLMGTSLPPLPKSTPARLQAAVEKAMGLRVDERPQTVAEFVALLGSPGEAPARRKSDRSAETPAEPAPKPAPRPAQKPAPKQPAPKPAPAESRPKAPRPKGLTAGEIRQFCERYSGSDFYVGEAIPAGKLSTARSLYPVPKGETAIALADATVFGSAKAGMVIGEKGIYWRNDWTTNSAVTSLTWHQLIGADIKVVDRYNIQIGDGNLFNMSGCSFTKTDMVSLLRDLQAAAQAPREPAPAPARAPVAYMLAMGGQQYGPFPLPRIQVMLQEARVNPYNCHVWKAGMTDWVPFMQVPDLVALLPAAHSGGPGRRNR